MSKSGLFKSLSKNNVNGECQKHVKKVVKMPKSHIDVKIIKNMSKDRKCQTDVKMVVKAFRRRQNGSI